MIFRRDLQILPNFEIKKLMNVIQERHEYFYKLKNFIQSSGTDRQCFYH